MLTQNVTQQVVGNCVVNKDVFMRTILWVVFTLFLILQNWNLLPFEFKNTVLLLVPLRGTTFRVHELLSAFKTNNYIVKIVKYGRVFSVCTHQWIIFGFSSLQTDMQYRVLLLKHIKSRPSFITELFVQTPGSVYQVKNGITRKGDDYFEILML